MQDKNTALYNYTLPAASHWSLNVKRGIQMTITSIEAGANLGMLLYNPGALLERYNAPDTLKCQHTFKLTQGHCLYSDMGRIFCSITNDTAGWHDTLCGNSTAQLVNDRWGPRDYQNDRNTWHQNGYDSFLTELTKYGLGPRDMAANVNFFSKVTCDSEGNLSLDSSANTAGESITLRFEMDTLVIMHSCPHPLSQSGYYPSKPLQIELAAAPVITDLDECSNYCPENARGFANNQLYYLGEAAGSTHYPFPNTNHLALK
jgi:urea carboxylase-associated protein 2